MTTIEKKLDVAAFERRLSECFAGGETCRRELRLTGAEADYLRNCPAVLHPMGGSWYEVALFGAGASPVL